MTNRFAVLTVLVLGSLAVGCRMCQEGYDYCGPAYEQGGYGPCQYGFLDRKGSILVPGHPPDAAPAAEAEDAEPALSPVPAAVPETSPMTMDQDPTTLRR